MSEVVSNLKPLGECEGNREKCGNGDCPKFGTLLKPARSDGMRRVRGCADPVARGKRNQKKGRSKQSKALKAVGSAPVRDEEHAGGVVRSEVKAGGRMANPVWTRFRAMEAQSNAGKAMGDVRPFVALFCPDGTSEVLWTFRDSEAEAVVAAMYHFYFGEAS